MLAPAQISVPESLERDVVACGVPLRDSRVLGACYRRALQSGSSADWIELYVGTFVTLLRKPHQTCHADSAAAQRLLQLLNDDLGSQLFDTEALQQVQSALHLSAA